MAYFFPETKQESLEEIAAAFGDKVVELDVNNLKTEEAIFDRDRTFGTCLSLHTRFLEDKVLLLSRWKQVLQPLSFFSLFLCRTLNLLTDFKGKL
jgi:hypothetical protein